MRFLLLILVAGVTMVHADAQTVGVAGVNDLRVAIDGGSLTGPGQPSCVNVTVPAGPHCMRLQVRAPAGSCLLFITGDGCSPNYIPVSPTSSVDVSNPQIAFACWQYPPGLGLFVVPPGGIWEDMVCFHFPMGLHICLQAGVINPQNGLVMTQAYCFTVGPPLQNCPAGTPSGLQADDGFLHWPLSGAEAQFLYYGTLYTELYVNANGSLSFTAGDPDFSETDTEMLNGPPRIACWDDLSPNSGGQISVDEDDYYFVASWNNVPTYPNVGSNSFCISLEKLTGAIAFDIGPANTSWNGTAASSPAIFGISAGGGLGVKAAFDLSMPGALFATGFNHGIWQHLNAADGPYDLDGMDFYFYISGQATRYILHSP
jgi:hypothetical protein